MKGIIVILIFATYTATADIRLGLVAHWTFDNDSLIVPDISGNSYHGKAYNINFENGIIGNAAKFDAVNDRIIISDKQSKLPDRIAKLDSGSISIWFKYQNVGGQVLPLFYYGESSASEPHNSMIIEIGHSENAQNRRLYFTIAHSKFCFDTKINLENNKWYHFVAVVGSKGNTGWLNGVELTDRNYNLGSDRNYTDFFSAVTANELCAIGYGRYGLNDNFFTYKGLIDDLRIYNRPLSANDVAELYQLGSAPDDNKPTFENVKYGAFDRNVLDLWLAKSSEPTPLVIFIHGGGFISGDKSQAQSGTNLSYLKRCLDNKVSFAAINYRFKSTTRLDTIMLDVARALQYMRYKAKEWNIDKNRIASFGGSAGGGATIWLAFGDDLADPSNADPVLRESTRLTVGGHLNSQATYDFNRWPEILELPETMLEDMKITDDLTLYHIPDRSWYDTPEITALRKKLDMVAMIDKSDPPMYFQSANPNIVPTSSGAAIHHPKHPMYLKKVYDSFGLDNAIVLAETPVGDRVDMLDFFFRYLLKPTGIADRMNNFKMNIFPNPAADYIEIDLHNWTPSDGDEIKFFNDSGEMVLPAVKLQGDVSQKHRTEISHLPVGLYFLKIGNNTKKLMVVR